MSTSDLKSQLATATKDAMRARDSARLGTLRLLSAAIKQREVDERIELTDQDVIALVEKQVKQRRESIAAYQKAGRDDTAAQEQAEIDVLQEFLPAAASAEEVAAVIDKAIADAQAAGAQGPAAMGQVMAAVKAALAGRAEMSAISREVNARLRG